MLKLVNSTIKSSFIQLLVLVLLLLCFTSSTHTAPIFMENAAHLTNRCGENGDCVTVFKNCTEPCGCDNWYYYEKSTNECLLNLTHIKQLMVEKYNTEEYLRQKAENVFQGIIVAVYFFVTCTSVCALSACIYCCRLNYSDYILNKDVKALAHKLHRDAKLKKSQKKETQAIAESCNVVVEDAGVFVC